MVLRGIFKCLTGGSENGLFPYLTERNKQKALTKRAERWQAHTADLPSRLSKGTVYEEITPDGSVKIWTPPTETAHISVTLEHQQLEPSELGEIQRQQARRLEQEDVPLALDPFTGPDGLWRRHVCRIRLSVKLCSGNASKQAPCSDGPCGVWVEAAETIAYA